MKTQGAANTYVVAYEVSKNERKAFYQIMSILHGFLPQTRFSKDDLFIDPHQISPSWLYPRWNEQFICKIRQF